jgi:hypothetical protein
MTSALRNALTSASTFLSLSLSLFLARILSINTVCSIVSKQDWTSASSTHW